MTKIVNLPTNSESLGFSFDLAEVQFQLEKLTKRKVDIGFVDSFKPYIFDHVKPDLKLIYERPRTVVPKPDLS